MAWRTKGAEQIGDRRIGMILSITFLLGLLLWRCDGLIERIMGAGMITWAVIKMIGA